MTPHPHPDPSEAAEPDSLLTRSSLVGRLRDLGDDQSWGAFFERYWRLIYNVARKSGLSDVDAQDVVQETVISVARKMPAFRYDPAKGSFKQWLLLITRRRIQDRLRQTYRDARPSNPHRADAMLHWADSNEAIMSPDTLIDAAWAEAWRAYVFEAALARVRTRVNPKHFQVFDCCVLQGLPPRRVAQMLGLNAAQVYLAKHRVSAAVKRAAAEIEKESSRTVEY
jgi:RNA polymerase sigma factor (sigma-70 family)